MWTLANASNNRELVEACLPTLAGRFTDLTRNKTFLSNTDTAFLAALLTSVPEYQVTEEAKLEMISAWMNSSGIGCGASYDRAEYFDLLLPLLDLQRVSHDFFLSVACDEALRDLPSSCKPVLAKAWKAAHSASPALPSTSRSTHRYAACMTVFLTCNSFSPSFLP